MITTVYLSSVLSRKNINLSTVYQQLQTKKAKNFGLGKEESKYLLFDACDGTPACFGTDLCSYPSCWEAEKYAKANVGEVNVGYVEV